MAWPVNARTSAMMDEAQALYGATITATQGSPSTSDPTSAGTHAGQGVIDVVGADLDAIVIAMRQVGFAAWHRTPAQGFPHHVHGVAVGEPLLSSQAKAQVDSYLAGYNGLRGNGLDDGPRDWVGITWETYTGGTYVPPTGGGGGTPGRVWNQYPGDRSGMYALIPGGILAGTPTIVPADSVLNYFGTAPDGGGDTLFLDAGDSIMLAAQEDYEYGEPQNLTAGYWLLRTSGSGTVEVADAYDLGFNYPSVSPSWVVRSEVGTDPTGLRYFAFDPTMLDASHLYFDGEPLIRLRCTAGSVEVTFVGYQIQPASGFWLPDDLTEWSATQPAATQLIPYPSVDGTYDITAGGGGLETNTWTIDGTPVYQFTPLPGMALDTFGRKVANENSFVSPGDAITNRDSNIVDTPGGTPGLSTWELRYDNGLSILGNVPESWRSILDETPQLWTAPTKSALPSSPPGIPPIGWARSPGIDWLDFDSDIQGWVIGPTSVPDAKYVQVSGDAQIASVYAKTYADFVYAPGFNAYSGTLVAAWEKVGDDDLNLGIPYDGLKGTFDEYEIDTTDNLLILSSDSTIRTEPGLRHTYPTNASIEGYTAGVVAFINLPVAPKYRLPPYRFHQPSFVLTPGPPPLIDFDEEILWLRQRQRNDGLGNSVIRAYGRSSRQRSLRQRGYR